MARDRTHISTCQPTGDNVFACHHAVETSYVFSVNELLLDGAEGVEVATNYYWSQFAAQ